MFSLRKEINLINTQKEKQNQLAERRQTLLTSQQIIRKCNVLSKEIDEMIKMLDPIGLDDLPITTEEFFNKHYKLEPSEKETA